MVVGTIHSKWSSKDEQCLSATYIYTCHGMNADNLFEGPSNVYIT